MDAWKDDKVKRIITASCIKKNWNAQFCLCTQIRGQGIVQKPSSVSVAAGARLVLSDLITDDTLKIIIMLHPVCSCGPTPLCEDMSRTKQMEEERKQEQEGGWEEAYLQLPENLRLPAGLEVLQSLGPEAVVLVQGALATRGADESMTMQEPEHESSPAVWRPVLRTNAAWEMQFLGCEAGRVPLKISQGRIEALL